MMRRTREAHAAALSGHSQYRDHLATTYPEVRLGIDLTLSRVALEPLRCGRPAAPPRAGRVIRPLTRLFPRAWDVTCRL